jgi:hypothetical protein
VAAAGITVITASLPERAQLLVDCIISVARQDPPLFGHLVHCEERPVTMDPAVHASRQLNILLAQVETEWVSNLDDDDYLLGNFSEVMGGRAGADVIYSWGQNAGKVNCNDWTESVLDRMRRAGNFISANGAIVRTEFLRSAGGWPTDWVGERGDGGHFAGGDAEWQDWAMWLRLARAGATFRCVPEVTWHYRCHDGQSTNVRL